jgi:hypothetical protein
MTRGISPYIAISKKVRQCIHFLLFPVQAMFLADETP